jgi:hypothetical protein
MTKTANSRQLLAISVFTICFLLSTTAPAHADTLFSDGFESASEFDGWTETSPTEWDVINNAAGAHSGSKRAQVKGPGANDAVTKEISTSGYENISLNFWYKINSALESGDHLFVEWSSDGTSWTTLQDISSAAASDYSQSNLNISSAANQSNFQFRFRADLGATSDVVSIDDVELTGSVIAVAPSTPSSSEAPVRRSRPGRSRPISSAGQVLGASIGPNNEAQIAQVKAELIILINRLIRILQEQIDNQQ